MISGLNHITLAVSNLDDSLDFYMNVLDFKGHARWDRGAYLSVGSLRLCLSIDEPCPSRDYTHIAFDIDSSKFDAFLKKVKFLNIVEWKPNSSEGASVYLLDPDGHKLEVHVGSLKERLAGIKDKPYSELKWL